MKYSLKPKELIDVENFLKNSPHAKMIKEYQNWGFEIGDVLIRHNTNYVGDTAVELVSPSCQIPKKYRVVHIDELKVPWVKQVSVRGGLGNKLYCLLNYNQSNIQWSVDPEQIDSQLLGRKYDPRAEYKRMRTENPNYGGTKAE